MPLATSVLTMPRTKRWTHIRVPTVLAARLNLLRDKMQVLYAEGRIEVPNEHVEHIPLWYVIQDALDEKEARRVRSNRRRPAKPPSQPQDLEFRP
jgi:hypothetical protein